MSEPQSILADAVARCPACVEMPPILPTAARFCPRCGHELIGALPDVCEVDDHTDADGREPRRLASACESLRRWSPRGVHAPSPGFDASEGPRSSILLGYAKALFQLGWRYESGMGARHNSVEARRCYDKAARLGNVPARVRLQRQSPSAVPFSR